ncbi:protein AUXIN RESPONSE 4 [Gastrolobium bilobum]|uniref:protein AUXIN RESPONSE 4 n=1 Tax=Gastrolobium bilobum TaxID=150636 RepID=UPI002AAF124F|nr:protein AUXIN RESPONSE 4 [Gastrolobium bilobum]
MAIITEEPEKQKSTQSQIPPRKTHKPKPPPTSTSSTTQPPNPFSFWFYFTLSVSLLTLAFVFASSLSPQDTKTWFLNLPNTLRQHYSKGRAIKVQTHPNQPPIEVFTVQEGPTVSENVVIVHALGLSSYSYRNLIKSLGSKGVRVTAIDLPGNGFSDKSVEDSVEGVNGIFGRFWYVYSEIQEKGFFWAFDQIVETGQIPYEEILARMSKRKVTKPIDVGPQEIGRVLGQVIDAMGLAPVHLVLHDSALGLSANWITEKSELVRSVTLIDTSSSTAGAFPICVLKFPVIREIVLGFPLVYAKVVNLYCSKRIGVSDADAQRVLLKGRDGRRAVVAIGKNLNSSFDIAEWGGSDGLKDMPMQVLWSAGWSKEWSHEGDRVARALPQANFVTHSGGRWAQEDVAVEIAEKISQFVLSLPKSVRKVEQESIPDHIQKMFDEAKSKGHDHLHHHGHGHQSHDHLHHHGHGHGHGHDYHGDDNIDGAGYMDAYGLGQGPYGL